MTRETADDGTDRAESDRASVATDDAEAENRRLRERVEQLEAALAETREQLAAVHEQFDGGSDEQRAAGGSASADAAGTGELVTSGGQPTKVIGKLSDTDGIGVHGEATGGGATRGVFGTVESFDNRARAIVGEATALSGRTYGVEGRTFSGDSNAAGVRGEATNNDGETFGVWGETGSQENGAAGVRGYAGDVTGANRVYGVRGASLSGADEAAGVRGTTSSGGQTYGIDGETRSSDPGAAGVRGVANETNGGTYGVHGKTNSDDSGAAGVWAENDSANDSVARGLKVSGYRDVSQTTLSVYLDFDQTISDESGERVKFDTVVQNDWTSSEYASFGTDAGKFTVPAAGKYHVSAKVTFADASIFSEGDNIGVYVLKDLTTLAFDQFYIQSNSSGITPQAHVSKTLTGLGADDVLQINVIQNNEPDDKDADLQTGVSATYMTVDKIG